MGRLINPISEAEYNKLRGFAKWRQDHPNFTLLLIVFVLLLIIGIGVIVS
jgi:hypothetical protein